MERFQDFGKQLEAHGSASDAFTPFIQSRQMVDRPVALTHVQNRPS